ncbi:MAG: radical SAM protein [Lachnotalea sp.]
MFVKWDITGKCNLNCLHCSVGKEYNTGNSKYKDLDTNQVLIICDKLIEAKISDIQILGGEPFARADIMLVLKKLSDAGIRICINTNAQLLTEEIIRELTQIKIHMINVSFDGIDKETNDFVRGTGSFKRTLDKLHMLSDNKELTNKTMLGINFVIMKHTLPYAKELIDFCIENCVQNLAVNDLWVTQNAKDNQKDIYFDSIEDKLKFINQLCEYNDKRIELKIEAMPLISGILNLKHDMHLFTNRGCGAGEDIVYIQANGDVFPCIKCRNIHELFESEKVEDLNIKNRTLYEILSTNYFSNFCEFKTKMKKDKEMCRSCLYNDMCVPCPFDVYSKAYMNECKVATEKMIDEGV